MQAVPRNERFPLTRRPQRRRSSAFLRGGPASMFAGIAVSLVAACAVGQEQQEAWEYSPYRVRVWIAQTVDPTNRLVDEIARKIELEAEIREPAAWRVSAVAAPARMSATIADGLDDMTVDALAEGDLVVVFRAIPGQPEIRVVEDLATQNLRIGVCSPATNQLGTRTRVALEQTLVGDEGDSLWDAIQENVQTAESGHRLLEMVLAGQLDAAIVYQANMDRLSSLLPYTASSAFSPLVRSINTASVKTVDDSRSALEYDKLMLVDIQPAGNAFAVRTRELDCRAQAWGPVIERIAHQRHRLPDVAFDSVAAAFRPLFRIESVEEKTAQARLRAGGLIFGNTYLGVKGDPLGEAARVTAVDPGSPAAQAGLQVGDVITSFDNGDESLETTSIGGFAELVERLRYSRPGILASLQIQRGASKPFPMQVELSSHSPVWSGPGGVLQVVMRRTDRLGSIREGGIQLIDWTFLTVDSQTEDRFQCTVHSGTRNPLGGRSGRRLEKLAVPMQPVAESTVLKLEALAEPRYPLVGYEIYARDGDLEESTLVGRTDWRGMVVVPRGPFLARMLYVKNGSRLIARLPMVPGLYAEQSAVMTDDEHRLWAEGIVSGLQNQFTDLVAQRQVLAERVRMAIEKKSFDQAQTLIDKLESLPTKDDFLGIIADREAETRSKDPKVQARISSLLNEIRFMLGNSANFDAQLPKTLAKELQNSR